MKQDSIFIIILSEQAKKDIIFWERKNSVISRQIQKLIDSIQQTPRSGKGQPEKLRYELSGAWSRRIDKEHRLVYVVNEQNKTVTIQSCKGHYGQH